MVTTGAAAGMGSAGAAIADGASSFTASAAVSIGAGDAAGAGAAIAAAGSWTTSADGAAAGVETSALIRAGGLAMPCVGAVAPAAITVGDIPWAETDVPATTTAIAVVANQSS